MTDGRPEAASLRDYLRVLRRRKWIVLAAAVVAPAVAVALSLRQTPLYEASSEVLLRYDNLAGSLTGVGDSSRVNQDASRIAETQADLASTPAVAERALELSGVTGMTADELLDSSSVSAGSNTDVLTFTVEDEEPADAVALASAYANAYTEYRQELDTQAIVEARQEVEQRLAELEAAGETGSALYESLAEKAGVLSTLETLQTQNASVIREADTAVQTEPKTVRNALLAAVLGLVLGIGLALLFENLDTRVRAAGEIQARLRIPLLGRIPELRQRKGEDGVLVALDSPGGAAAEAFRVLRTNLEFVNRERRAQTIMVTSAQPGEGKSTTAANLAVTYARAGRHVALVDLDLRRPALNTLFAFDREPGLTDVALGRASLERASMTYVAPGRQNGSSSGGSANGAASTAPSDALLEVLPTGPLPPDPGEFINTASLGKVLDDLREHAELVLIDAPPLLGLGDALALSARVDGVLLVIRPKTLRRPMLNELQRVLDACPAAKMGFVLSGVENEEEGFGYAGYYDDYRAEEAGRAG